MICRLFSVRDAMHHTTGGVAAKETIVIGSCKPTTLAHNVAPLILDGLQESHPTRQMFVDLMRTQTARRIGRCVKSFLRLGEREHRKILNGWHLPKDEFRAAHNEFYPATVFRHDGTAIVARYSNQSQGAELRLVVPMGAGRCEVEAFLRGALSVVVHGFDSIPGRRSDGGSDVTWEKEQPPSDSEVAHPAKESNEQNALAAAA